MRYVTNQQTLSSMETFRQRLHSVCTFHGSALRSADERLQAATEEYRRSLEQVAVREAA